MAPKCGKVMLIRHGESMWNTTDINRNMRTRFTGWANIPLSDRGQEQAQAAGRCLFQFNLHMFDAVYTSVLDRSMKTYDLIRKEISRAEVEDQARSWNSPSHSGGFKNPSVVNSWRLNERHYGALIGMTKREADKKYGPDAVKGWRLSWDHRPPSMSRHASYFSNLPSNFTENLSSHDWQSIIWTQPITRTQTYGQPDIVTVEEDVEIPLAESIRDCASRVAPLWESSIVPRLLQGQDVLVVAHSNTIRGMVRRIDSATLSDENLKQVTIPSSIPMIYSFERDGETGVRPVGKLSPLGVRGRFVVTTELLMLSLAASQHLEMSENLDSSTVFKDLLAKTLQELTQQMRVHTGGGIDGAGATDPDVEDAQHMRNLLSTERAEGMVVRGDRIMNVMDPGWMSFQLQGDDYNTQDSRRD